MIPFSKATEILSGRNYATLSRARIVMSHLDLFLSTSESTRIDIMKEWLREQYQKYFVDSLTQFENQALHVYSNLFLLKLI
jgi:hypothetical protein